MPTTDIKELATKAVASFNKITNFGYFGDLPLGETWAFTISRHRDTDVLTESNYETIEKDMETRFPGDTETVHCGHWAVGWIDHLAVRMLEEDGSPTAAATAILEWKEKLEDYPVADDEDYSRREWEEWTEYLTNEGIPEESISDITDAVNCSRVDDLRYKLLEAAACEIGIWHNCSENGIEKSPRAGCKECNGNVDPQREAAS